MRYPQIILSITMLLVCTTILAGERPASAPPIDERLTGIEQRLDNHEDRLTALEGKAKACPCPDGPCICGDDCTCPDCPKHKKKSGPRVLLFTADWCAPCQAAKARLGDLYERLEVVDCTDGNPRPEFGEVYYPTAILLDENGKEKVRCVGDNVGDLIIRGWLEGRKSETPNEAYRRVYDDSHRRLRAGEYTHPALEASAAYRRAMTRPAYRPANYYQAPRFTPRYYGGGCYGGACATCR